MESLNHVCKIPNRGIANLRATKHRMREKGRRIEKETFYTVIYHF